MPITTIQIIIPKGFRIPSNTFVYQIDYRTGQETKIDLSDYAETLKKEADNLRKHKRAKGKSKAKGTEINKTKAILYPYQDKPNLNI